MAVLKVVVLVVVLLVAVVLVQVLVVEVVVLFMVLKLLMVLLLLLQLALLLHEVVGVYTLQSGTWWTRCPLPLLPSPTPPALRDWAAAVRNHR